MPLRIRPARQDDAADIARLTLQLGYEVEQDGLAQRLSRVLASPDQGVMVADADGGVVGWVHTMVWEYLEAEAFVVIGGLVVDESRRKAGIGRALMEAAEEWARARGHSVVRLWSSLARTEAHRFYERIGYTNIKTQYSFVKALDGNSARGFARFIPRVQS